MVYEEYLRSVSEGLIVVDGRGRIIDVNLTAVTQFGYSRDELAGQAIEVLLPQHQRELYRKPLNS